MGDTSVGMSSSTVISQFPAIGGKIVAGYGKISLFVSKPPGYYRAARVSASALFLARAGWCFSSLISHPEEPKSPSSVRHFGISEGEKNRAVVPNTEPKSPAPLVPDDSYDFIVLTY